MIIIIRLLFQREEVTMGRNKTLAGPAWSWELN